ncbi:MAG: hypothetical protein JRJ83_14285 [Deltaproteobacteria bacterium]|nr:hypothetical protein [Deltaproteobacteria bacterium]
MYYELKSDSQTNQTNFWNIADSMINTISNYLECTSEEFLQIWEKKCIILNVRFMGYHCTRHSRKEVFVEKGILPLSKKTIKLSQSQKRPDAKDIWFYRSTRGSGPYFFLSYKSARNPDNHFFKGPEILLAVNGNQPNNKLGKSIPLILHCEIPFSILPNKNYYTFCTLRAYFNYLDPEDDQEDLFEGFSIDLNGNALYPRYIVRIEEI